MSNRTGSASTEGLEDLRGAAPDEKEMHQEFVHRNIDFLIDIFTGEQYHEHWMQPCGCPSGTSEVIARNRRVGGSHPCRYQSVIPNSGHDEGAGCACGDPLSGSDDPLDAVAALAIATGDKTPAERYFDREERHLIADLRKKHGSWENIASLDRTALCQELVQATDRRSLDINRGNILFKLIEAVTICEFTDGTTLRGLHAMPYERFQDFIASFPGVSHTDGVWLMLVAFDKPVWPADPKVDRLLYSLGFLDIDDESVTGERHQELESVLTDRHVSSLYRALSGHAVKGHSATGVPDCELRKFFLSYRLSEQAEQRHGPTVLDLFSGAGGLSLGFSNAGFNVKWAIDSSNHATDTYRLNHPEIPHRNVICDDIQSVESAEFVPEAEARPDIIIGGPPCQAFSPAGYRARLAKDEEYSVLADERTGLYRQYVDFIRDMQPKVVVMENVEGIMDEIGETGVRAGDLVMNAIESVEIDGDGYLCEHLVMRCAEMGIPQDRNRVIIIGVREDVLPSSNMLEALTKHIGTVEGGTRVTLRQALSGLSKLKRGEGGPVHPENLPGRRSTFVTTHNLGDATSLCYNHQAREHPMEKDQLIFDKAIEPGETSWDIKYKKDEFSDLIEYDVGTEENPRFKDKYRMLDWSRPAPTVVAHLSKDANNFIIPDYYSQQFCDSEKPDDERNRGITAREAARLQTFPDQYVFLGPFGSWFRQIGNAVPPLLGEHIGERLMNIISFNESPGGGVAEDGSTVSADD